MSCRRVCTRVSSGGLYVDPNALVPWLTNEFSTCTPVGETSPVALIDTTRPFFFAGPEVGFEEIAFDLLQARFWIVGVWHSIRHVHQTISWRDADASKQVGEPGIGA